MFVVDLLILFVLFREGDKIKEKVRFLTKYKNKLKKNNNYSSTIINKNVTQKNERGREEKTNEKEKEKEKKKKAGFI